MTDTTTSENQDTEQASERTEDSEQQQVSSEDEGREDTTEDEGKGGGLFSRLFNRGDKDDEEEYGEEGTSISKKLRLHIKLAQDVAVPRTVAYNQWTQLEDLPQFMKGVQSVEVDDNEEDPGNIAQSNWTVKIGITRRQFSAEVTEAVPDERIAWQATGGCEHTGVVSFASLDDNLTRVQVQMEYIPGDFIEKIGNIFLAARRKARKDLRLFKHYMELSGEETGAWRGEITPDEEEEAGEEGQEEGQEEASEQ